MAPKRQRQVELCEFKASLVYRVSSRTARATQRNPVLKNQPTNQPTNQTRKPNRSVPLVKSWKNSLFEIYIFYVCECSACMYIYVPHVCLVPRKVKRVSDSYETGVIHGYKLPCSFVFLFCFLFFQDRVSLCSPGCPGTHFVDQCGLKLRNLPASASQVLGLKACTTMPLGFYVDAGNLHNIH